MIRRIAPDGREALARRGHQVTAIDEWSWVVGGGQGMAPDLETGAAQRCDGHALAI
jgi:hypothetical protein